MESIVTWSIIFTRSWEDGNNKAIARIFKDASDYLQAAAETDRGIVIIILSYFAYIARQFLSRSSPPLPYK
jgi:hypothetical protein